jgi:hypothetical protein
MPNRLTEPPSENLSALQNHAAALPGRPDRPGMNPELPRPIMLRRFCRNLCLNRAALHGKG